MEQHYTTHEFVKKARRKNLQIPFILMDVYAPKKELYVIGNKYNFK
jgi:hypothetical protein